MNAINTCHFVGNLTRDPELKYTPKGTAVANVGVALNHSYTPEGGQRREEVTFIDLTAFGRIAEIIAEYARKGEFHYFQARAKQESWDDKQTGQKRSKIVFIVESFTLIPNPRKEGQGPSAASERLARPSAAPPGRSLHKPQLEPDLLSADAHRIEFVRLNFEQPRCALHCYSSRLENSIRLL